MNNVRDFISNLDGLNIETINICNLSGIHSKCPVSERLNKFGQQKLSINILKSLFTDLEYSGFKGRVALHHYSEPLMDDRIIEIIQLANNIIPNCRVNIWSNGSLLNEEKAMELMSSGVYWLRLSAYSIREYIRLNRIIEKLRSSFPNRKYYIKLQKLDDRKEIYNEKEINNTKSCWDMRELLIINSLGELQLCCRDYLCKYKFGNIYEKSIIDILEQSNYLSIRDDLIKGKRRKHHLCRRCIY